MNIHTTLPPSAGTFVFERRRRILEKEEIITGDEAAAYANRKDNRALTTKLVAADAIRRLRIVRDTRVLEVACGTGDLAREIYSQSGCMNITATDASVELIHTAQDRHEHAPIEFNVENLHSHPGENTYSAVICKDAFHHFPDPSQALREMLELLHPNGRLYLFDLCRNAKFPQIERRLQTFEDPHEQERFLRSLNASLNIMEYDEAIRGLQIKAKRTVFPMTYSLKTLEPFMRDIATDQVREYRLGTLFVLHVIQKL